MRPKLATKRRAATGSRVALVAMLALTYLPLAGLGTALGATATVRVEDGTSTLEYTAAPGEMNRLEVEVRDTPTSPTWTLSDMAAPVTAGRGCTTVDSHSVRCVGSSGAALGTARFDLGDQDDEADLRLVPPFGLASVTVDGADGDDRILAGGENSELNGGAGDDYLSGERSGASVLDGGPGNDQLVGARRRGRILDGGPGADVVAGGSGSEYIYGGGGSDRLDGGGGRDVLSDGDRSGSAGEDAPGPDILDGGRGKDVVTYADRVAAVRVDLADEIEDGEVGEGDTLLSFTSVTGGKGDDRLAGSEWGNTLDGGPGRDHLIGRGGRDQLWSRTGGDTLSCGDGRDRITNVRRTDHVAQDCEEVTSDSVGLVVLPAYPTAAAGRRLNYRVRCPNPSSDEIEHLGLERCSGAIELRQATGRHSVLATGQFPPGRWKRREVTLLLTSVGRRLAARSASVRATLSVRMRTYSDIVGDDSGRASWLVRLRL